MPSPHKAPRSTQQSQQSQQVADLPTEAPMSAEDSLMWTNDRIVTVSPRPGLLWQPTFTYRIKGPAWWTGLPPATSQTRLMDLPDELLLKITSHLTDNADLFALSMTCRKITHIAQVELFNKVVLPTTIASGKNPAHHLLDIFETLMENPELAAKVLALVIERIPTTCTPEEESRLDRLTVVTGDTTRWHIDTGAIGIVKESSYTLRIRSKVLDLISILMSKLPNLTSLVADHSATGQLRKLSDHETSGSATSPSSSLRRVTSLHSRGKVAFDHIRNRVAQYVSNIEELHIRLGSHSRSDDASDRNKHCVAVFITGFGSQQALFPSVKVLSLFGEILNHQFKHLPRAFPCVENFTLSTQSKHSGRAELPLLNIGTMVGGLAEWSVKLRRLNFLFDASQLEGHDIDFDDVLVENVVRQNILRADHFPGAEKIFVSIVEDEADRWIGGARASDASPEPRKVFVYRDPEGIHTTNRLSSESRHHVRPGIHSSE